MNWPNHGVHFDVPFDLYRSDDITQDDTAETIKGKSVSKSLLLNFAKDPGAWKASPPKKATKVMKGGSLFDCLLTTPDEFEARYTVSEFADFRTNAAKAWRIAVEALGIEVVTDDQIAIARDQIKAVMAHPDAARLINGSRRQVAFRHRTAYGFSSKGLIDIMPEDESILADLKVCEPGALESRHSLQKYILKWGIHVQAGNYTQGVSIATECNVMRFKVIFVTSAKPYRVAVIELPYSAIHLGECFYNAAMKQFAACMTRDKWPSLWDNEMELDVPAYAYLDNDESEQLAAIQSANSLLSGGDS